MEISRTSQGGQTTFDTSNIGEGNVNVPNKVTAPSNIITTSPSTDQNTGNDKSYKEKDIKSAVDRLNKFVEADNISVEYNVHPQFKDLMIKIVDKSTGDVLVEVPPKKILDMVAKMCELAGIIFDKKA